MKFNRRTVDALNFLAGPEPNQAVVDLHLDLTWRSGAHPRDLGRSDHTYHGCELRLYYVESERQAGFRRLVQADKQSDFLPPWQSVLGEKDPNQGRVLYELAAHTPFDVAFHIAGKREIDPPKWLSKHGYDRLPVPTTVEYRFVDVHGDCTDTLYFPRRRRDLEIGLSKLRSLLRALAEDPELAAVYRSKIDLLTRAEDKLANMLQNQSDNPGQSQALADLGLRFCIEPFTIDSAETWSSWCDLNRQGLPIRRGNVRKILANGPVSGFYFAAVVRRNPDSLLAQSLGIAAAYLVDPPGTMEGSGGAVYI